MTTDAERLEESPLRRAPKEAVAAMPALLAELATRGATAFGVPLDDEDFQTLADPLETETATAIIEGLDMPDRDELVSLVDRLQRCVDDMNPDAAAMREIVALLCRGELWEGKRAGVREIAELTKVQAHAAGYRWKWSYEPTEAKTRRG